MDSTAIKALKAMLDEESELVTIYYGKDIREEDGEKLLAEAKEACPNCEVELHRAVSPFTTILYLWNRGNLSRRTCLYEEGFRLLGGSLPL